MHVLGGEALDAETLVTALLAGDDRDIASRTAERGGDEGDQGVISRAVQGRGSEPNDYRLAAHARDRRSGRLSG